MVNHDNGYKRLFSHASVVADLLRGFVKEDWVREVDLRTLERVEGSFITRDLRSRETDMLWRVQWQGGPLFIFVVLEFQSRVDPFMAGDSVHTWLTQVLMPAKFPDLPLSEAQSLEEVRTMLADRVMEWTREWEQKGREEGIHAFQDFLLSEMEERFGPVPETIRLRVEETQDLQELKRLGKRLRAAGSLADLGF